MIKIVKDQEKETTIKAELEFIKQLKADKTEPQILIRGSKINSNGYRSLKLEYSFNCFDWYSMYILQQISNVDIDLIGKEINGICERYQ